MKVLLVNPLNKLEDAPRHIPFEAAVLAHVAHTMGHQVGILDLNAFRLSNSPEGLRKEFSDTEWKGTDVICVVAGSTQFAQLGSILPVARQLNSEAVILAGGPLLASLPKEVMKLSPELDVAYVGEGENTFKEILDHVDDRRWERVRGVAYRQDGRVLLSPQRKLSANLDAIPYPKYDLLPLEEAYFPNSPLALSAESFMSRRRMSFSWGRNGGRRPSPRYCVENVKQTRLRYAIDFATITDELADPAWLEGYCREYIREGLHESVPWGVAASPDMLASDPLLIRKLREAGCRYVHFDFGSASDAVLQRAGRRHSQKTEQLVLDEMGRNGLGAVATFGLGFPEEGVDDVLETVGFLVTNRLEVDPFIQALLPDSKDFETYRAAVLSQYGDVLKDYLTDLENSYGLAAYLSQVFDCGDLLALKALVRAKDVSRLLALSHKRGWGHADKWKQRCPMCSPDVSRLPESAHASMVIAGNPNKRA